MTLLLILAVAWALSATVTLAFLSMMLRLREQRDPRPWLANGQHVPSDCEVEGCHAMHWALDDGHTDPKDGTP